MKIETLKERAQPGSNIVLLLSGGAEVKGKISRFEESSVAISNNGRERIVFAESITGFELPTPLASPTIELPAVATSDSSLETNVVPPPNAPASLTWVRALEHVDAIRRALVTKPDSGRDALSAAEEFARQFEDSPLWIQEDPNIRFLIIQAFKAVEHQQKQTDAEIVDTLPLSQTLVTLNRLLRKPSGIPDEKRFVDLYHFHVATRTHPNQFRNNVDLWRDLEKSLSEAHEIGIRLLSQPNLTWSWEREPHLRKVFFYRLSEICNALLNYGFTEDDKREYFTQKANEYAINAGRQTTSEGDSIRGMGTIASFDRKGFGLIHTRNQSELLFSIADVISVAVRDALLNDTFQSDIAVDFDEVAQPTELRDRATHIRGAGFVLGRVKRLLRLYNPTFGFLEFADGREAFFPFSALPDENRDLQLGDEFLCSIIRSEKGWTTERMDLVVSGTSRDDITGDDREGSFGANKAGHGRITSFGNQGFGFIDTYDGRTLFFRIESVVDVLLYKELSDAMFQIGIEVVFREEERRFGQRYGRAIAISSPGEDTLLKRAKQLEARQKFREALDLVRSVLQRNSSSRNAIDLEESLQQKLIRAEKLPRDSSAFSQAKRAWVLDQDFDNAEKMYRLAISRGERLEAAVKDLASLLQQMKRGDEAITLLEEHAKRPGGAEAFDGMLATSYEHGQRYHDALKVLLRIEPPADPEGRAVILRRIGFAYFKLKQLDYAERTLKVVLQLCPNDFGAERLLAAVQEVKTAGNQTRTDEVIAAVGDLADYTGSLSPLAKAMLNECSFEGVAPKKVESGDFGIRDVDDLFELVRTLGAKRPRDRAAYALSAAAIAQKLDERGDNKTLQKSARDGLRLYFTSMGDAAWANNKHLDVIRTYYAESLSLSDDISEGDRITLEDFLISYATPTAQERLSHLRQDPSKALVSVVRDLITHSGTAEPVFNGIIHLSIQSRTALNTLWPSILRTDVLFTALQAHLKCERQESKSTVQEIFEERRTWLAQQLRKLSIDCEAFRKLRLNTPALEDFVARLRSLDRQILCDLDRQRLTTLSLVAEDAVSFCRAGDFEERERHYFTLKLGTDKLCNEIKDSPTTFSFESLLPVVKHLGSLVEESYADLARSSVPEIQLELVNDSYVTKRDSHGDEVTLQLQISNRVGCSPASNIEVQVGPSTSPFFHAHSDFSAIADSLRGGRTTAKHWRLRLTQAGVEEKAFAVAVRVRFQNSMGQKVAVPERKFTVRLYSESEFQAIDNPYAPHAHGGAVKNSKMFFGREEFIQQVCSSLLASGETKSILIHGQKRAGKSSVLDHIKRRLSTLDCLPIAFSLQSIGDLTQINFLFRILQEIRDAIQNISLVRGPGLELKLPDIEPFAAHPAIFFHECLGQFLHKLRTHDNWRNLRLILLIDEFTDIFSAIQSSRVPREFMKLWKAVIEKGYFSCVLVGKDIMPEFKKEFPNEFGVTDPKRITYLAERYARELIEVPIGAHRYKSNAVPRILELTAGSPFYTMMFCDKLVDYMNRTRSLVVTEADVEKVKESLISGQDFLDKAEFDPFYSAGEGKVDTGINPNNAFTVCSVVAKKGDTGDWCSKSALTNCDADLEHILSDLQDRDVLERKGNSFRIKVGLFREWLLVNT